MTEEDTVISHRQRASVWGQEKQRIGSALVFSPDSPTGFFFMISKFCLFVCLFID